MPVQRNTKQKELILECLKLNNSRHLTSDNIFDILKKQGTPVSKSTIYRYLTTLEQTGSVRKYIIDGHEHACYQFIKNKESCCEHYHLICSNCNKTIHFESNKLTNLLKQLSKEKNFQLDIPKTIFYGICENCKNIKED